MEKIFLPSDQSTFQAGHTSSLNEPPTLHANIRHRSRSFHKSENVPISNEGGDQNTPTEVFSVSALHVT